MPIVAAIGAGLLAGGGAAAAGVGALGAAAIGGAATAATATLLNGGNRNDYLRNITLGAAGGAVGGHFFGNTVANAATNIGGTVGNVVSGVGASAVAGAASGGLLAMAGQAYIANRNARRARAHELDALAAEFEQQKSQEQVLQSYYQQQYDAAYNREDEQVEARRRERMLRNREEFQRHVRISNMLQELHFWRGGLGNNIGEIFSYA